MATKDVAMEEEDNKYCLTEFGPVPESPENSFSWSSIFKWNRHPKAHSVTNTNVNPNSLKGFKGFHYNTKRGRVVEVEQNEEPEDSEPALKNPVKVDSEVYTKRFSNVIRKISNALDRSSSASSQYSDDDLKQYWMPDRDCKECYDCGDRFTTFRRRHHCRICGQVFCSSCCNQEIPGKLIGCRVDLRVCVYCCKVVLSCLQTTDWTAESSVDFKLLQDQLLTRLGMVDSVRCRKNGVGFTEHGNPSLQSASNLQDYRNNDFTTDEDGTSLYNDKTNFTVDPNVSMQQSTMDVSASHNSDDLEPSWVSRVNQNYANIHHKGTEYLLDSTEESPFSDSELRKTCSDSSDIQDEAVIGRSNNALSQENENLAYRDSCESQKFNMKDDVIHAGAFNPSAVAAAEVGNLTLSQKSGESDTEKTEILKHLGKVYEQYERQVVHQLLERHGLSSTWAGVILPIIQQIVRTVKLNTDRYRGEMDIRPCVQIKKIPGGVKTDCVIVNGVVCTKNVAHKQMRSNIVSPTILLIKSPIIYQRQENKFLSLEPALLQETSYLRNVVAKIIALKPDVVLVENTVSRLAQNFFLDANVTLVLNVKSSVMNRIARLTNANVTTSIDAHFAKPQLGTCKMMSLTKYQMLNGVSKTLMTFDGCETHLGCTILLRGATNADLCKVKRIMRFMLFMNFNQKLEISFLSDELAVLPGQTDDSRLKECAPIMEDSCNRVDGGENTRRFYDNGAKSDNCEISTARTGPMKFRNISEALNIILLNISPSISVHCPFFENSELNKYFPELVYNSSYLDSGEEFFACSQVVDENERLDSFCSNETSKCNISDSHPFICAQFSNPVFHGNVQNLLSDFRAKGGCSYSHLDSPWTDTFEDALPDISIAKQSLSKFYYGNDAGVDVLDPFNHQSLSVLFCSYSYQSSNNPYFCIDPWIVRMEFYGLNDISLGGFLEKYCFRASYTCPSSTCDTLMINHVRRFVHHEGCIYILLHKKEVPLTSCGPDSILFWSWCRKCKVSSKITAMSAASRALSFAKYLDLRFHNSTYIEGNQKHCSHSLHHDHYQYFACRDIIAAFKYSSVSLLEVKLPSATLCKCASGSKPEETLVDEIRTLAVNGHGIYDAVLDKLQVFTSEAVNGKSEIINDRMSQLQQEKSSFRDKVQEIQIKLTSINDGEYWKITDSIVGLKKYLAETVITWNIRLTDCIQPKKKDDRAAKQSPFASKQQAPQIDHDAELISTQSSKAKAEASSRNSVASMEPIEDDRGLHAIEEPCMDYFSDAVVIDNVYLGDQSPNQSVEALDNSRTNELVPGTVDYLGLETPKAEKKSTLLVKNMISQLLSLPAAITLQMPFSSNEHHMLPHCEKVPLIVYDNEPSSVIAYALCSADYELGIQEMKYCVDSGLKSSDVKDSREPSTAAKSKLNRNLEANKDKSDMSRESTQAAEEHLDIPANPVIDDDCSNPHLEVQFADSSAKFYCRVYFAKQFLKLREVVLPEGEEAFIRSLSRCSEWQANGGKSGCLFCKTHDDRFVLKQMTRLEVQSFLEFAPYYIDYMLLASSERKPAALVKILGAFQITHRQIGHSNTSNKMDLLVMENLFYGHEINKTFDLKGSIRNRLVNITGKVISDVVLQDENLLKMACDYPLYVRQHSKMILSFAIQNDTRFLSDHLIMDYSLLVGINEKKKELVVGIIDYIRTFTWDKKLENLVKSSGILGGQGRTPTVISPELYRNRFCEAMDRYILLVPDQWCDFGPMDL